MLQEAVSASKDGKGKCCVAYFDVVKAFDSIGISGLFRQLYDLGVTGRIWRILRKAYIGFKSRVRIHFKVSDSPKGYSDNILAACRSKDKVDRVIPLVNQQGKRWRYKYKARKSAILVYGENK